MIAIEGVRKTFKGNVAIKDLTLRIKPGEIFGLLGANGAGKSTTMRILSGYMPATEGTAKIAGIDVFEDPLGVKRRIGYLPELPPVYLDMTVRGYLAFVARLKGARGAQTKTEIGRVAEQAGVDHILGRLIRNISKGYRQRVGLAQALLMSPEVLILDEPTVGLDPIQIEQVRRLITELGRSKKHTIILSTHILSEVKATCQRIIMIAGGRIVADAPLAELEQAHGGSLEQAFAALAVS